ncbi:MAG TPA: LacI family DNA-binding transcriptional regulator [Bacteroidales bacterium]|nr:LacI family DNA-binding transcriptional regulator [Bacteroidales bacterium]
MLKGKVTIKDIARELGISPSTVSKALKNHPDISPSTRKAVSELVKKLHYQPDPIALSLKIGQSKTIGVVIPEIVHYFFSTVISGMEDLAYDSGYHVMFCQSNESFEREVKSVQALMSSRVDGILVSQAKTTFTFDHYNEILDSNLPLVFFDRICESVDTDRVIVDDEAGACEAVKHLVSQGCRNIVHLCGPQNLNIGTGRKDGYIRALKECGLPVHESNIIRCDTAEEAQAIVPGLLKRRNRPDGIFAVNDLTAAESMKIIKKAGLSVPDDVALVGFTSGIMSDLTDPPLSSVEQFGYTMGKEAVRLLLERIEKKNDKPSQTFVIKTKLVVKGSSQRK